MAASRPDRAETGHERTGKATGDGKKPSTYKKPRNFRSDPAGDMRHRSNADGLGFFMRPEVDCPCFTSSGPFGAGHLLVEGQSGLFWQVPAHHFPRVMIRGLAKPAA
jgi:hypothetical protein